MRGYRAHGSLVVGKMRYSEPIDTDIDARLRDFVYLVARNKRSAQEKKREEANLATPDLRALIHITIWGEVDRSRCQELSEFQRSAIEGEGLNIISTKRKWDRAYEK